MSVLYKYDDDYLQVAGSYTGGNVPVGVVLPFMGKIAPIDDWLMCDGSAYDTNKYAGLFQILGTDHVPDMRNKTTFGAADTANIGDVSIGALPNVVGSFGSAIYNSGGNTKPPFKDTRQYIANTSTQSAANSVWLGKTDIDFSTLNSVYKEEQDFVEPASLKVNYIIKAR